MLGVPFGKMIFHLPLGGEFWLERIQVVAGRGQKFLPDQIRRAAENFPQHRVGDEWLRQTLAVKNNSARRKFFFLHRDRRDEMAEDAFHRVRRAAPDAEETEDVVYAERVEIISHLREPFFPPRKTVVRHARPVVSGEAPVLALRRERIRRRARLQLQVEKFRRLPRIRAVLTDADGDVALQHEAGGVDVCRRFLELLVQVELEEKVERDFIPHRGGRHPACRSGRHPAARPGVRRVESLQFFNTILAAHVFSAGLEARSRDCGIRQDA